jgi:hypothetical protein
MIQMGHESGYLFLYCQAQFQLAIAVAIERCLALLSLLNRPATHPPVHSPGESIKTAFYSSNS